MGTGKKKDAYRLDLERRLVADVKARYKDFLFAEEEFMQALDRAREDRITWTAIGQAIGISRQAARERYVTHIHARWVARQAGWKERLANRSDQAVGSHSTPSAGADDEGNGDGSGE
jgi:hypothetical protein